jgi:hypothetical protein
MTLETMRRQLASLVNYWFETAPVVEGVGSALMLGYDSGAFGELPKDTSQ